MFFVCVKVSRQVKLELQDSEYFHVVGPKDAGSKISPGMSATFTICFTPLENKVLETRAFGWSMDSSLTDFQIQTLMMCCSLMKKHRVPILHLTKYQPALDRLIRWHDQCVQCHILLLVSKYTKNTQVTLWGWAELRLFSPYCTLLSKIGAS